MRVDETRLGLVVLWVTGVVAAYEYVRQRGIFAGEWSPVHRAILASSILVMLAALLAVLQGLAALRFRRAQRLLRANRPEATVAPYEGPEGDGLLFEDALGRVLLLRGTGGWGDPVVVERPAPVPAPPPEPIPLDAATPQGNVRSPPGS